MTTADLPAAAGLDPKTTPWRPDLAAAGLRGRLPADRYAEGAPFRVRATATPVTASADAAAPMTSQLLAGEPFTVYEINQGWAWGQSALDAYVGYVPIDDLAPAADGPVPDHRLDVPVAHIFPAADLKRRPLGRLSLGARVRVLETVGNFAQIGAEAWVARTALAPADARRSDWAGVAEAFLGAPYLWGGRSADGFDCSGLVQVALQAAGHATPRDSDQQAVAGPGPLLDADAALQRGDLAFFPDHVGLMVDATRLVHANATAMAVTIDPLDRVAGRIAAEDRQGRGITAIRRPPPINP